MRERARGGEPLINPRPDASVSSLAVAGGLLATTLFGALQAVVLVAIIGPGRQTDAFLAAYSLYYALVIVAASVRAPFIAELGPLADESRLRGEAAALIARALTLALVLGALSALASPLVGLAMSHGLGAPAVRTTSLSFLILTPAAVLQIYATAASGVLNAGRRFALSSGLYALGSLVAVSASALLLALVGVLGAAGGLLLGALVLATGHAIYLRRFGIGARPAPGLLLHPLTRKLTGEVFSNAALGMSVQLGLTIALAAVGSLGDAGQVTNYSYGYFVVIALTGFTSLALNMVVLPDVVAEAARSGAEGARVRFLALAPFTFAILVPIVATLLAFGKPLLDFFAGPLLSAAAIEVIYDLAVIFSIAALAQTLLNNGATSAVSLGLWRMLWIVSLVSLAAQAAAVALVRTHGVYAIAGAHAGVAALTALGLLVAVYRRRAADVLLRTLWIFLRTLPAAVVFVPAGLLAAGAGAGAAAAGTFICWLVYAAATPFFVPEVAHPVRALIKR